MVKQSSIFAISKACDGLITRCQVNTVQGLKHHFIGRFRVAQCILVWLFLSVLVYKFTKCADPVIERILCLNICYLHIFHMLFAHFCVLGIIKSFFAISS